MLHNPIAFSTSTSLGSHLDLSLVKLSRRNIKKQWLQEKLKFYFYASSVEVLNALSFSPKQNYIFIVHQLFLNGLYQNLGLNSKAFCSVIKLIFEVNVTFKKDSAPKNS